MILSQVKSIVIPVLVAAGVQTTGASVVAFQFGGGFGPAGENRPGVPPAAGIRKATAPAPAQSSPAQGEVQLARQIIGDLEKKTAANELNDPESYNTWSLRLLEAEKRQTPENSPPLAAHEGHVQRMTGMLRSAEKRAKAGQQSSYDVARWKYFAKAAERLLDEARRANPAGAMGAMMRDQMAGGGMVRGAVGASGGGSAGSPAEKPATAEGAPTAGAQAQAKAQAGMAAGGGGGFGGPSDNSRDQEQIARIQIARMSAAIATLDKNPKNLAVIKKLEEPVTLHFPVETPLEVVLKHVKDATKVADGKRLSIYVDPLGLQEADKTMTSPVIIDLEDVPLRLSLRLVLKQLGLAYCVRDGVVVISAVDDIKQELWEAQAEQMGLNPDKFPMGMGGMGMGGMGMGGMGMGGMR